MQYWADLQSVHGFCCYDNSAEHEMSASVCTRSMPGFNSLCISVSGCRFIAMKAVAELVQPWRFIVRIIFL